MIQDSDTNQHKIYWIIAAGYKALFITVDAPVLGHRLNEKRNPIQLSEPLCLPNFTGEEYTDANGQKQIAPVRTFYNPGRNPGNSWESVIPWVKANTKLEIWLKGSKSI